MNNLIDALWIVVIIGVISLAGFCIYFEYQNDIDPHAVRHVLLND